MGFKDMWRSFSGRKLDLTPEAVGEALTLLAAEEARKEGGDTAKASPDNPIVAGEPFPNPEEIIKNKGWPYVLDMERNDRTLGGLLRTRELAVTQMDWQVVPGGDEDRDKEIAEFVRRSIDQLPGGFDVDMGKIWDAWRWGYSVVEEVWGPWSDRAIPGEKWNIIALKDKPPWSFEFIVDQYGNLESLVQKTFGVPERLDPSKFILGRFGERGWNPYGRGLVQESFLPDWFLRQGWKFWAMYIERYVGGVTIGKYGPNMKPSERSAFRKVVESLKSNANVTISTDEAIEYLTAATGGSEAYKDFCHEQRLNIAFTITGSELVSMVGDSGSRSLGEVHAKVNDRIISSDAKRLFGIVNEQYVRRIVQANYGDVPMPVLIPDTDGDLDRKVLSEIVLDWHERGLPVSHEYLRREFDIEEPAEDETVLEKRVVSVGPVPPGPLGGIPEDQDDDATRFAATAAVPKKITNRTATKNFIDDQTTETIDESVKAAAAALKPALDMLIERGMHVWEASNLNENGRPKADMIAVRPPLPMSDFATVSEEANLSGAAIGLQSATDELSALGVTWDQPTDFALEDAATTFTQLSAKVPVTRAQWDAMAQQARAVSITVSGMTEAEIVSIYQRTLLTAVSNGWSADQWVSHIQDVMSTWTDSALSAAKGTTTEARLRTIFRTNVMRGTNEARLFVSEEPSSDPVAVYLYTAILDGRETPLCNGLDGRMAPLSHWRARALVPPNHFNCRSYLTPILTSQMPSVPADAVTRKLPASLQPFSGFGGEG